MVVTAVAMAVAAHMLGGTLGEAVKFATLRVRTSPGVGSEQFHAVCHPYG